GEYSIKELFSKIQTCETLDEIMKYLYSLCSDVVQEKDNDANHIQISIVNKIRDYVEKHYNVFGKYKFEQCGT
ncbi:MAG: hypothetical protein WBJ37_08995, partial [Bacteroidales bacterium]